MPKLSLVIPTYNRARLLRKLLSSLRNQDAPPDSVEIIVVDDGSNDDTRKVALNFSMKFSLRYIYQENRGVAAARNAGLNASSSPLVGFLADDYTLPPDYCSKIFKDFENPSVNIVKPLLTYSNSNSNFIQRFSSFFYNFNMYLSLVGMEKVRISKGVSFPKHILKFKYFVPAGGAAVFRRSVFKEVGGFFDPGFTQAEDSELGFRIFKRALPVHFDPRIRVIHYWRPSIFSFFLQVFQYAVGIYYVKKKHPDYPVNLCTSYRMIFHELREIIKNSFFVSGMVRGRMIRLPYFFMLLFNNLLYFFVIHSLWVRDLLSDTLN